MFCSVSQQRNAGVSVWEENRLPCVKVIVFIVQVIIEFLKLKQSKKQKNKLVSSIPRFTANRRLRGQLRWAALPKTLTGASGVPV